MAKYVCETCGYVYDEETEGTKFEELDESWVCPLCALGKEVFNLES